MSPAMRTYNTRQIGCVVNDLDRAVHGWLELGVGPWFVMRDLPMRALYRGKPCETTLSVAWANSGEMQIGVIQQLDNTAAQPRAQGQPVWRQLRRSSV
jgi:hypothetical protein